VSSGVDMDAVLIELRDVANYGYMPRRTREAIKRAATALEAAQARIAELDAELARRDANENRNCINWGPCSRHDGKMGAAHD